MTLQVEYRHAPQIFYSLICGGASLAASAARLFGGFIHLEQLESEYLSRAMQPNGQLVVLEGTVDGTPYQFTDLEKYSLFGDGPEERLRFYCAYYDETKKFVDAYAEAARTGGDTSKVNSGYFAFHDSAPKTYAQNYAIEVVRPSTITARSSPHSSVS